MKALDVMRRAPNFARALLNVSEWYRNDSASDPVAAPCKDDGLHCTLLFSLIDRRFGVKPGHAS
ncbi:MULTISPECIES: hypothetical protein [unclassified Bradyrhizobium]|uniref:hypothetical protein n=1 Tax=unclassified Bradyrhizobium TaxID=2631580 RepID=UPI0028EB8765|nr:MULTISPECIES: hypothetical protein [unclassified Bradyrhizobium]